MTAQRKAKTASPKLNGPRGPIVENACSTEDALEDQLVAAGIVIPGEDAEELRKFVAKTTDEFKPVGHVERVLSEQIAIILWRQTRIPAFEAAVLFARDAATADKSPANQDKKRTDHLAEMASRYLPSKPDQNPSEDESASGSAAEDMEKKSPAEEGKGAKDVDFKEAIGRALIHDSENNDVLGKLMRAERSLATTLRHLMRTLNDLQSARREAEDNAEKANS